MADNNYFIAVNYHYIGSETKFKKGIYPVAPSRLAKQIDLLRKDFDLISEKELLEFLDGRKKFNRKPGCILTFDDGLKCQYQKALPILKRKKAPAVFFINSAPVILGKVCLAHKIHYISTKIPTNKLLHKINLIYRKETGHKLKINAQMEREAALWKRYDNKETAVFKYLVNRYLPEALVEKIFNYIFIELFGDEKKFASKIYFDKKNLLAIKKLYPQFSLGLHGADHFSVSASLKESARKNVLENYFFLKNDIGLSNIKGIAYPFGLVGENDLREKLFGVLRDINLIYGFTIYRGRNYLPNNHFLLNRFDANDVVGGKFPIGEI
jgi:peptidoglycan/xylan/chitin deacetylase (PgdA/CDA1 family)